MTELSPSYNDGRFHPSDFADFPEVFEKALSPDYDEYLLERRLTHLFEDTEACSQPQIAEDNIGRVYSFNFYLHTVVTPDFELTTHEILIADFNREGIMTGWGMVTHSGTPDRTTPPFVGWTETYEGFKGGGLGGRRLRYMNMLCLESFGVPLRSALNGHIEPEAVRVWEKLVESGEAIAVTTEKKSFFCFKDRQLPSERELERRLIAGKKISQWQAAHREPFELH